MTPRIILDTPYACLWFHSQSRIVHHELKQAVSGQPFRDLLDEGYKLFLKHRATKWLSDDRNIGITSDEDLEWTNDKWFPRMLEAGWKYWAIVKPSKALSQIYLKRTTENYAARGLSTRTFDDVGTALRWLESL